MQHPTPSSNKPPRPVASTRPARRGVTVLEVLFATGVAIAGMFGIASLLLMAGRQASESNRSLESQTLGHDWYNEFLTRDLHSPSNWVWYQDYEYNAGGVTIPPQSRSFQKISALPLEARLTHSGASVQRVRPTGKMSVCIDPYFYSNRFLRNNLGLFNESNTASWYRLAVFPHYDDDFNPIVDSASTRDSGLAWMDQPRMLRVALGSPSAIWSEKLVQEVFSTNSELVVSASEDDRTIPALRGYSLTPLGPNSTPIPTKGLSKNQYSWMATLSPLEEVNRTSEDYYTLSLVVMYQRDRFFDVTDITSENKPEGEGVTWVVPLSGNFTGGSGGRVRLISSVDISTSLGVGDWIMLSKFVGGRTVGGSSLVEAFPVFRWYRIVATDVEPDATLPFYTSDTSDVDALDTTGLTSDPYGRNVGNNQVWVRDVVLDGPDWDFNLLHPVTNEATGAVVTVPAPTTGTLVQGVVAVHERVVEIPNAGEIVQ
ncbi:MAG TPA: hypothetical protein DDW52_03965 [Planctomycetaceae bacterium]|nr:hypothetical protein [Planctomycetaceae bacterium]